MLESLTPTRVSQVLSVLYFFGHQLDFLNFQFLRADVTAEDSNRLTSHNYTQMTLLECFDRISLQNTFTVHVGKDKICRN